MNAVLAPGSLILILMRGAPGSGKSTLAKTLLANHPGGVSYSTDDYFCLKNGFYEFDPSLLPEAHKWNQERAFEAMSVGITPVIIDNTHTCKWEAKPYVVKAVECNYCVKVCEPDTEWWKNRDVEELARRNSHGVPAEAIQRMIDRWEVDFTVDEILKSEPPHRGPPRNNNHNGNGGRYRGGYNDRYNNGGGNGGASGCREGGGYNGGGGGYGGGSRYNGGGGYGGDRYYNRNDTGGQSGYDNGGGGNYSDGTRSSTGGYHNRGGRAYDLPRNEGPSPDVER
ncbi:NEDD4-binding protein 2 [Borealophlyctis nickersoniae]|nr:NEDD4-binding protein 2 [Borealophlyctis nickersoniae]